MVNTDRCKGCALCVEACPKAVITLAKKVNVHGYPYVEAVKLATRVHRAPSVVLKSYLEGRYSGDILKLLEPEHSIYPYVIENGEPLKLLKINTDII